MVVNTHILSVIGGAFAALIAGKLLLTTKYPRTSWVVMRYSRAFWAYLGWYALFGFIATEVVLLLADKPTLFGIPRIVLPLLIAFFLAVGKMKVADAIPAGDQIEPWLRVPLLLVEPEVLHQVAVDESFGLSQQIQKHAPLWTDLEQVRARIKEKLPRNLPDHRRFEFENKLKNCETAEEALAEFIRQVTIRWFRNVFSVAPPEPHTRVERTDIALPIASNRKSPRSAPPPPPRIDSQGAG